RRPRTWSHLGHEKHIPETVIATLEFGRSRFAAACPDKDGEALMTVLEYDAPVRSSGHVEFDFSKIDPAVRKELRPLGKLDNYHAIPAVLQDFAIIAISVWLCVGVS